MTKSMTARYFSYIAVLYFIGNAYILGGDRCAGRNSWAALLISTAVYVPLICMYGSLASRYPGMDLFHICHNTIGRKATCAAAVLYIIYGAALLSMSMSCLSRFVSTDILTETPKILMALTAALCAVLLVYAGGESMGKWAAFILPGVLAVMLAAGIISIRSFKFENLLPVEIFSADTLKGAYRYTAFPFAEPVVMLALAQNVEDGVKIRHLLIPWLTAAAILALTFMRNTLVLGGALSGIVGFATFQADSVAGYNGLQQRIEAITSMIPAISAVMEASVVLLFMVRAAQYIFGEMNTLIPSAALSAAGVILCTVLYKNNIRLEKRAMIWPLFSVPMQVIIPFSAWLICIMRGGILQKRE